MRRCPEPIEWPTSGGVYFVRCGDRIKIGHAASLSVRLRALQTASPGRLELLAVASGGIEEERAYHFRFRDLRLVGEWFTLGPDVAEEVRALRARGQ